MEARWFLYCQFPLIDIWLDPLFAFRDHTMLRLREKMIVSIWCILMMEAKLLNLLQLVDFENNVMIDITFRHEMDELIEHLGSHGTIVKAR